MSVFRSLFRTENIEINAFLTISKYSYRKLFQNWPTLTNYQIDDPQQLDAFFLWTFSYSFVNNQSRNTVDARKS